jgi:hypothetical protein
MLNTPTDLYTARADAERGIERCDKRIQEAQRDGSPLASHLPLYIHQRRAYALTAARTQARTERSERGL